MRKEILFSLFATRSLMDAFNIFPKDNDLFNYKTPTVPNLICPNCGGKKETDFVFCKAECAKEFRKKSAQERKRTFFKSLHKFEVKEDERQKTKFKSPKKVSKNQNCKKSQKRNS